MAQSTQARTGNKAATKAEQEAQQKALRRAEQANILAGVRPILEPEEQLLAFARARIAGGWRGKLNVGPEAFFAPFANVALTERRFLVQHVHHSSGRPSEMLPHSYALGAIARATFTDIETFGGEPACRLILHLQNGLYVRLRLRGQLNFAAAQNIVELFDSLTLAQRTPPAKPFQTTCANCGQVLDQDYKFCPYCGTAQASASGITLATEEDREKGRRGEEENTGEAQSAIGNRQSAIAQETDFAYERADQPAEFGTALPLPEVEPLDVEPFAEEPVTPPEETVSPGETGMTTAETVMDAGAVSEDMPQEAREDEPEGRRQTLEPDDLATLNYPLTADFESSEPVLTTETNNAATASVEFAQYDTQDFTEFPFDTSEEPFPDETTRGSMNVADSASDVVREGETEAFLPSDTGSNANNSTQTSDEHHDSFAAETPHVTGDDNIDFNVPTTEDTTAGNQATDNSQTDAPLTNGQPTHEPPADVTTTDAPPADTQPTDTQENNTAEHPTPEHLNTEHLNTEHQSPVTNDQPPATENQP